MLLVSIPRRVEGLPIHKPQSRTQLLEKIEFQYPEGWKAFRYRMVNSQVILKEAVSIPRRVEGLPIRVSMRVLKVSQKIMFQYPEGWKAFRYKRSCILHRL